MSSQVEMKKRARSVGKKDARKAKRARISDPSTEEKREEMRMTVEQSQPVPSSESSQQDSGPGPLAIPKVKVQIFVTVDIAIKIGDTILPSLEEQERLAWAMTRQRATEIKEQTMIETLEGNEPLSVAVSDADEDSEDKSFGSSDVVSFEYDSDKEGQQKQQREEEEEVAAKETTEKGPDPVAPSSTDIGGKDDNANIADPL